MYVLFKHQNFYLKMNLIYI